MPCYAPLQAWRSIAGPGKSGKRKLAFSPSTGFKDLPVLVACGQCIGCRLERSRQWAVRCVHEAQLHEASAFITLTYAPQYLPVGGTLVKKHFQDFMKRLRRRFAPRLVRFFHCGEYGDDKSRPHYHACLFGVDFSDKTFLFTSPSGSKVFTSPTLDEVWGMGRATTGDVTFESAAYVARYVCKKVTGPAASVHYERVDAETGEVFSLLPEYITMSLKPGIGAGWIQKYWTDVYPKGDVVVRGVECKAPRYYDKLFEIESAKLFRRMKRARARVSVRHAEDHTPRRLEDARIVKEAQVRFLKRPLGSVK